ncbi:hypothetical protein ASPTUDRAFT_54746 [Aspergillus tubingensis CBS 134.48]|uniref:O-methylsterigmatocystin oxidoreductase n=1 Tax=Aspergillus tubingensis (strain CBS 134.48) TaxID=767770 RepID=A0A1L9N767_ASPTC|nr:hypothetical protein ASPTUDRAFT_54746 [Aspergillus tubingensis CBS 134.48]
MSLLVRAIVGLLGLVILKSFLTRKRFPAPLPPGPKPKPIIGNLFDLPANGEADWLHWYKHKKTYGPISSVQVFGETLIIVNDAQIAVELLEKRSATHSDRPGLTFIEMFATTAPRTGYFAANSLRNNNDPRVRTERKLFYQQIGSNNSVARFNHIQEAEVGRTLLRVRDNPEGLQDHIRKQAAAIILKVAYGYSVVPHGDDPLVDLIARAMGNLGAALVPGVWLVDFIPFLRHIPAWFPGATFKRVAENFRESARAWNCQPYEFVRHQMSQNKHAPSYLSGLLEAKGVPEPGSFDEITISTLGGFFLAMVLYPDVQRKAQEEIDRVVGTDRLPSFSDRDNLPYIDAMVKEALRWHSVTPMGVVHCSSEDDMYEGYFIPKGSQILPNQWAFTHDPDVYPDPMAFKPERFLATENHAPERDPHLLAFGFGRRICPGRTLADSNVYLSIAQSLAVYSFSKPIKNGKEVDVEPKFLNGVISHVAPFEVGIKPRSKQHEALLKELEIKYPWEEGHAAELSQVKF